MTNYSELINNIDDNNLKTLCSVLTKDLLEKTQQIDYLVAQNKQKDKIIIELKMTLLREKEN